MSRRSLLFLFVMCLFWMCMTVWLTLQERAARRDLAALPDSLAAAPVARVPRILRDDAHVLIYVDRDSVVRVVRKP
jgi:hypothetical protein